MTFVIIYCTKGDVKETTHLSKYELDKISANTEYSIESIALANELNKQLCRFECVQLQYLLIGVIFHTLLINQIFYYL